MDTFVLRTDGGTQPRRQLDEATVERYREDMAAGLWDFARSSDPAVAFYDGTEYWLGNGFHRLEAATRAGMLDEFSAGLEIRQGTLRDAILFSVSVNPRTACRAPPTTSGGRCRGCSTILSGRSGPIARSPGAAP